MSDSSIKQQGRIKESNKYIHQRGRYLSLPLGLVFLRGLYKQNYCSLARVWDDKIGHPVLRSTMAYNMLQQVRSSSSPATFEWMDDASSRDDKWKMDRFAAA